MPYIGELIKAHERSWPKHSMSDQHIIDLYVGSALEIWQEGNFDALPFTEATFKAKYLFFVHKLSNCLKAIFIKCGIPQPIFVIDRSFKEGRGVFAVNLWKIKMMGFEQAWNLNDEESNWELIFIDLASTLYHEARHTEQSWLIVCWCMLENWGEWNINRTNTVTKVAELLKLTQSQIPKAILEQACTIDRNTRNTSMPLGLVTRGDSLFRQTIQRWFEDDFGKSRFTVQRIYQNLNTLEPDVDSIKYWRTFRNYENISLEYDAFKTEAAVRASFFKYPKFRTAVLTILKDRDNGITDEYSPHNWISLLKPDENKIRNGSQESPI